MLAVRTLDTVADFSALRADWDALAAANSATSIFQTWAWLYSWWETYGSGHRLRILVASDARGRVCGIAPLMMRRSRAGLRSIRVLDFIGAHSVASEYLDFLAEPGREREVATAFASHIFDMPGWDLLRFHQLSDASPTRTVVAEAAAARGLCLSTVSVQASLYVRLPATWDAYMATLSSHARKHVRQYRRKIEAAGGYEVVEESDAAGALDEFERLHNARMRHAGRVTSFESPSFRKFHQLAAARCAGQGWLRMFFLRHDGRNVAALYAFSLNGRMFFYNSGFDPAEGNQNVGAALLSYCIERCIAAGMTEFDFLGPGDYKERWGVEERGKLSFAVGRRASVLRVYGRSRRGGELLRKGIQLAVPASVYRYLGNQRKQLLLRMNRPLQ